MANGLQVSRETFESFDTDSKLNTLFDLMVNVDRRLEKLERRKQFNMGTSAITGFVGGFTAIIAKWWVSK